MGIGLNLLKNTLKKTNNMRNMLCVVVYDRYENLDNWIKCWKLCEHYDFEMVVIHNQCENPQRFKTLCNDNGITYVPRENVGMDIGAMQDVCKERLDGLNNDWGYMFWVTDDYIPMTKTFLKAYIDHYDSETGIVATEVSDEVKRHIRTSGFLVSKEVSKKIRFPTDPILTKDDCYDFEHLRADSLYEQMINGLLKVAQATPIEKSVIWDTGHRHYHTRYREHDVVFGKPKRVLVICPIYKSFPQIVSSMYCQTHKDWLLLLVHDGKEDAMDRNCKLYTDFINDPRVKFAETKERGGKWGHDIRKKSLEYAKDIKDVDYIVITNGDNYHTPTYLETLIKGFNDDTVATYCAQMAHSYIGWSIIDCKLERGYVDCAGVMVKKDVACEVGWNDTETHSADWTYFQEIGSRYGWDKFKKVEGCLLIHN